jgi:hypothetical protein
LYWIAKGECILDLQICGNTINFATQTEGDIVGIVDFFHPKTPQHLKPTILVSSGELICYVIDPPSLERLFLLQPELGSKFCKFNFFLNVFILNNLQNKKKKR